MGNLYVLEYVSKQLFMYRETEPAG
jgi:hypothetical protein